MPSQIQRKCSTDSLVQFRSQTESLVKVKRKRFYINIYIFMFYIYIYTLYKFSPYVYIYIISEYIALSAAFCLLAGMNISCSLSNQFCTEIRLLGDPKNQTV